MRRLTFLSAIILAGMALSGCPGRNKSNPTGNTGGPAAVHLQQQWFANSGFAGELCAMHDTASKYNLTLRVTPGSDQIDTKQVVKLGEAEFGVSGAEQILQANEKGANLVVVGAINPESLACFISKKPKGILKPADFRGHKIGTMEGSPVDLVYQALKKSQGLDIPKGDEVPTQWVLTGFTRGQYDVYPAFINDEPITLRKRGMDLNVIKPRDYGVNFIGTVYFCKRELVEKSPDLVQRFVNSVADGWKEAIQDPKKAISYLKEYDKNIDVSKESQSLATGLEYYRGEGGKVLYCSEDSWKQMATLLQQIGALKEPFQFATSVDNRFVEEYHRKYGEAGPQ